MIRAIAYRRVDMTDQEFSYYKELVSQFTKDNDKGEEFFKDLFESDDDGFITFIKPNKPTPWAIIFFMQQVMITQRLRIIDNMRKKNDQTTNG